MMPYPRLATKEGLIVYWNDEIDVENAPVVITGNGVTR